MCVTLQSRFRSTLSAAVCVTQFFRDISTLLINTVLRIEGQFASFQAQRVCVSWFGTIKLLCCCQGFDTAASHRHVLFSTHPQSDESCEVVLMCVTSQDRFRNTLVHRSLRDATLSRPTTLLLNTFGIELKARSRRFKCSVQGVCVSWFGTIKFFVVAVVLTHKLRTRTICDPSTIT